MSGSAQTVVITGASSGIGLATAELFSENELNVVGVARSTGRYVTDVGDVCDPKFRARLLSKYKADVVVNSAARLLGETDQVFLTNCTAAVELMHAYY